MATYCTTLIEMTSNSRVSAGTPASPERRDFIREIVAADVREGRVSEVVTRFPPEPNGYLHLGHPKAIALSFGIAQEFGGRCHLRFDDTNPIKEEQEYIDSIQEDIRWLGFDWGEHLYFASDYFHQLYDWAVHLIKAGKAYVDDLSADKIREHRGTLTEPGKNGPWRDRSIDENLNLFERMRAGEFPDGAKVLRAKIDMASPNINMRDPVLYRILHATHPRTGDEWCIYPLYDFAHGQSDAIEGITHSLCTLEFEDHRPLYDWLIENLPVPSRPHQYEFARLNFTYTVLSKRFLGRLVSEGHVRGWDDPRMPTLSALRRRGFPPEGLRNFLDLVSLGGKGTSAAEIEMLEHEVRDVLNREGAATLRRPAPAQARDRELPRGAGRGGGGRQQPGGSLGRDTQGALRARALDRTRRLHGGPATQVLPPRPRPRSAFAQRLLRDLHRRGQGRERRDRRAPLRLRSGDARRRRPRRAPAEGDAALALVRARRARPGAYL